MKTLPLKRPLVVFDLETTGTHTVTDRIVEIAAVKLAPDGSAETWVRRINPGMPIPAESTQIHGIGDEDVRNAPSFGDVAQELAAFFADCDVAGFNVLRFDLPFLTEEFRRANVPFSADGRALVDAQVIFHKKEPRTLEAALRYYCGLDHPAAHSALGDVEATLKVLLAQINRYEDLPDTMEGLHGFCDQRNPRFIDRWGKLVWKDGEACIGFGPHRGKTLREIASNDPNFLTWILRKDFPGEVKEVIEQALQGVFPTPPPAGEDETDLDETAGMSGTERGPEPEGGKDNDAAGGLPGDEGRNRGACEAGKSSTQGPGPTKQGSLW